MSGDLSVLATDGIEPESVEERADGGADVLAASLRYLFYRGVVNENGGRFTLTDYGAALYRDRGFLLWLVGGYGGPLSQLDALLRHGKRYGQDLVRDGRWVADGTALMARENVLPEAMALLKRVTFDRIVDLGCGNARFLTTVCDSFGAGGIGVDVSPAAYGEAEKVVAEAGLGDRIQLVLGDVRALGDIPGLGDVQLAVTFYLLHEILAVSRETLVGYLADLSRRLTPKASLVIGEIEPPGESTNDQRFTPEFAYVHALMGQRLLSAKGWTEVLAEGGFAVREVVRCAIPGGILIHCQKES